MDKKHYVYVLRCADGTLYTGWTTDLRRRVRAHNSGKGAKYTRARRPVELVYAEEFGDKIEAQRREYAIKQLTRAEKEKLIAGKEDTYAGIRSMEVIKMSDKFDDLSIEDLANVSGGEYFKPCTGDDGCHDFAVVEVKKTGFVKKVHFKCSICGYEYWKDII